MRPLYHPSKEDISTEGILYALSDPIRAQIYSEISCSEDAPTCSTFLTLKNQKLPKSTLCQHFKILREAGLIRSERKGVELRNFSRCGDLKERFGDLIRAVLAAYGLKVGESVQNVPAPAKKKAAVEKSRPR